MAIIINSNALSNTNTSSNTTTNQSNNEISSTTNNNNSNNLSIQNDEIHELIAQIDRKKNRLNASILQLAIDETDRMAVLSDKMQNAMIATLSDITNSSTTSYSEKAKAIRDLSQAMERSKNILGTAIDMNADKSGISINFNSSQVNNNSNTNNNTTNNTAIIADTRGTEAYRQITPAGRDKIRKVLSNLLLGNNQSTPSLPDNQVTDTEVIDVTTLNDKVNN